MNKSASNFKVLKQQEPSKLVKVIDHNKPYSNNITNSYYNTNPISKSKSQRESDRMYELLKQKQVTKKSTGRSIYTETNRENSQASLNNKNSRIFDSSKGGFNFDNEKHVTNQTYSAVETKLLKNKKLDKSPNKIISERISKRMGDVDKSHMISENISTTKGIEDQSDIIRILKEENMVLKEKIESLLKAKENIKLTDLKLIELKELFCNEAKDFLEYLKSIDKAFSFNYSILDPIEFNETQLKIFFKNLRQNIKPIKRLLEEHQEELRSTRNENYNLLKEIANYKINSKKDKYQNEMIYSKGSMRNSGKNSLSPKNKKVTIALDNRK